jgi:hypothetical protein
MNARQQRRARLLANGMCGNHPNRPAVPGKTQCQKCLDDLALNGPRHTGIRHSRIADGRRWERDATRGAIWTRDKGTCVYCHEPVPMRGFDLAHYFVPVCLGGTNTFDNLRVAHGDKARNSRGVACNLTQPKSIREDCPSYLRIEAAAWQTVLAIRAQQEAL